MALKPGTYLAWSVALLSLLAIGSSIQNFMLGLDFVFRDRHYTAYNNFVIFRQSFEHLINGLDLYAAYPNEHGDYYKYSPAFALLMAPLYFLPVQLGLPLWNLGGCLLLYYGLKSLRPLPRHLFWIIVVLAPEVFTSLANSQSNIHLAGLLLLCHAALEKQRHGTAAALLMFAVFIKIFAIAFLPLWLFYNNKVRAALWLTFFFILFAFGPALLTGFSELMWQYQNWMFLLKTDHDASIGLGLLGLLQAFSGATVSRNLIILFGVMVLLFPLVNLRCMGNRLYRVTYFCLLMVWVVLFNHKAESPTFIIPVSAVAVYAICYGFDGAALFFLIGHLVFTSLSVGDLVPAEVRRTIVEPYRVKAVFPALFMMWLVFRLLRMKPAASGAQQLPGVLQS